MKTAPTPTRFLLIVSCSKAKTKDAGLLPALERYDGPAFKVIRKLKREGRWNDAVDIIILSAKFGLIGPDEPIPYYDQIMTSERALELQESVSTSLAQIFSCELYSEVFCHLGPTYLEVLPAEFLSSTTFPVTVARGRIGQRISALKGWILSLTG